MNTPVYIYGLAVAAVVLSVAGIQYLYMESLMPTSVYLVLLSLVVLITGLGIWYWKNNSSQKAPENKAPSFKRNRQSIKSLSISQNELKVLEHLADGKSNQEIANKLSIHINAVNEHLSSLYQKLEVKRRSKAIQKARNLRLIP